MPNVLKFKRESAIREEAAEWFLARREGMDAERMRQFARWLAASPEHRQEFREMERVARLLSRPEAGEGSVAELVAQARAADEEKVLPFGTVGSNGAGAARNRRWAMAASVAFLAVFASVLWWKVRHPGASEVQEFSYRTTRGQFLTQPLADGSVLQLDTDTQVVVRYSKGERQVRLEQGRAMFQVVHNAARPFRVLAGSAQVIDIGTKFDVYLQRGATLVTVIEGRVSVGPSAQGVAGTDRIEVGAGQRMQLVDGQVPAAPVPVDTARAAAWLDRKITFEHEPLGAIAAEFNRYASKPVVIETPGLNDLKLTGSLRVDDLDSFVAILRSLEGVRVEITPTQVRVSRT